MRGLRVAFGLLLAASVGVLAWRACGGLRVETDLTSLVSAENLPALRDVSADRTRQGRLLFEGPGADAVRAAADAFSSNLPACATFGRRASFRRRRAVSCARAGTGRLRRLQRRVSSARCRRSSR